MNAADKKSILSLADEYRDFSCGDARVTYLECVAQKECRHMFGFLSFGAAEDTRAVFAELERYCGLKGVNKLIGPVNLCSWFGYRIAVDGFEKNIFPDIENTEADARLMFDMGYLPERRYFSKIFDVPKGAAEQFARYNRGGTHEFKLYQGDEVLEHIRETFEISLDCYQNAPLFLPIPYAVYERVYIEGLKGIYPYLLAVYKGGEMVGYVFFYRNPDDAFFVAKTIGLRRDCQKGMLTARLIGRCIEVITSFGNGRLAFHYQSESLKDFLRFSEGGAAFKKTYALLKKEF